MSPAAFAARSAVYITIVIVVGFVGHGYQGTIVACWGSRSGGIPVLVITPSGASRTAFAV